MSLLFKQIAKFSFLLIFLGIIFFSHNKFVFEKVYDKNNFFIHDTIETIIMGDSHTMSGLNPKYLKKSINLSNNNEMYVFTYNKLKLLISDTSNVKNIILAFSYHNISNRYDHMRKEQYETLFNRYFPILEDSSKQYFRSQGWTYYKYYLKYKYGITFNILSLEFKYFMNKISLKDYQFLGNYYVSQRSNLDKELIKQKINEYYFFENQRLSLSFNQKKYLERIIKYCLKNKIYVFLYNGPIYNEHYKQIPNYFWESYNKIVHDLMNKYENLEYINLSEIKLPENYYGDGDHLNGVGAIPISIKVDSIISTHNTSLIMEPLDNFEK